ncbi:MAG: 50S ribosomal protein L4 [Gemmatimonadales bacterium]
MLEVPHYSSSAKRKGKFSLPREFDGTVNKAVMYQAIRAFRNNQRQGNASTKTRSDVSGGRRKPWRQKGTGRARQGTIRAAQWRGGGIVFGPHPRSYRTDLPRKVRRLARQSALNQRAVEGALYVIEALAFDGPKTKRMVELLDKLSLTGKKVMVLTDGTKPEVCLSARNLRSVEVRRYSGAATYDILWSDVLLVEEKALKGEPAGRKARSKSTRKQTKSGNMEHGGDDA